MLPTTQKPIKFEIFIEHRWKLCTFSYNSITNFNKHRSLRRQIHRLLKSQNHLKFIIKGSCGTSRFLLCMKIHHETSRRWAIMQTSFIIIRVAISRFTNAMNQFHVFRLNNDTASTIFWLDWLRTAQHATIAALLILTLAPWFWEIPFFTWCQASNHIIVSTACF